MLVYNLLGRRFLATHVLTLHPRLVMDLIGFSLRITPVKLYQLLLITLHNYFQTLSCWNGQVVVQEPLVMTQAQLNLLYFLLY